jgi:6-pyruvoyltetrahydropterin/6-carboxytetrahydropterin synthase
VTRHRITIARPQYKFSCAHMTVFPDGTKERLHGHNYTVSVALDVASVELAAMIPFAGIKASLEALCQDWKEHVLLAERSPFMKILRDEGGNEGEGGELELTLCGKRYVMPREDALLLPIDNVSVEALAAHIVAILSERIAGLSANVQAIEVTIEEVPGQGASCALELR